MSLNPHPTLGLLCVPLHDPHNQDMWTGVADACMIRAISAASTTARQDFRRVPSASVCRAKFNSPLSANARDWEN